MFATLPLTTALFVNRVVNMAMIQVQPLLDRLAGIPDEDARSQNSTECRAGRRKGTASVGAVQSLIALGPMISAGPVMGRSAQELEAERNAKMVLVVAKWIG